MVYKPNPNKYKQCLFNVYTAAVNGYSFLAPCSKILLSVSRSKCLHLLFMTHLLHVWFQQRLDGQKGKRTDIKEIKDSEPEYPSLQCCSDKIKSVNCKIRQPPCQPLFNPPPPPGCLINSNRPETRHFSTKGHGLIVSTSCWYKTCFMGQAHASSL